MPKCRAALHGRIKAMAAFRDAVRTCQAALHGVSTRARASGLADAIFAGRLMVSEATAYLRREVSTRNDKFTVNLGFWPAAPHPRRSRPEEPR